ncbi:hypothetical protein FHX48_000903 [Microbacterium halimionae]|uniref:Uncharacterized protein n=1 Tax=Microbacterium halimionae TaxID=1526413 RepID=A0A7W3JN48_9MICO|nr:hypothetical protein [Microbacterium halimionae]MBA8815851.1 hypothetical protein [Microbacterium halimionae]NII95897.1 hypothetical protein [Microbacterium halimionae]
MTFNARIEPYVLEAGQPFTVFVNDAPEWSNKTISAQIDSSDDIEPVVMVMSFSMEIGDDGTGSWHHASGFEIDRESVVFVSAAGIAPAPFDPASPQPPVAPDLVYPEFVSMTALNSPNTAGDKVVDLYLGLQRRRATRFEQPLGTPGQGSQFRAAVLVEGLLITQPIPTTYGVVHPQVLEVHDGDLRDLTNASLEHLGWPGRVNHEAWNQRLRRNDFAVFEFPQIWAENEIEADTLVMAETEKLVLSLAYLRSAAPRPILIALESRTPQHIRFRSLREGYTGNLIGGFMGGESSRDVLRVGSALTAAPEVELYVNLYLEARREKQEDSRYFKLWAVLETIAINEVPEATKVFLDDGTQWPDGGTTSQAAPRVFELVRSASLAGRQWPDGGDLYDFIRTVYGRRNATAHYGRFTPTDPVQQAQSKWYPWAVKTLSVVSGHRGWLWELDSVVHEVVGSRIAKNATAI